MESEDKTIVLISSEGDCFEFSEKILELSEWISALPDPFVPAALIDLGIDSQTLHCIQKLLESYSYNPPICPDCPLEFINVVGTRFFKLFREFKLEELLKITLASSKIGINRLTDMCCLYIADVMNDLTKENYKEELAINSSVSFGDIEEWAEVQYPFLQSNSLKLPVENDNNV